MIIGVQKGGTTALYTYLSKHPQIAASTLKEVHFFNSTERFSRGVDYYHSFFPLISNHSLLSFDASPSYFRSELAPSRIHTYNPEIRLILLLRNPIDRAYSAWNMYLDRYRSSRNWFYEWQETYGDTSYTTQRRTDNALFDFDSYCIEEINEMKGAGRKIEAPILEQGYYANYLKRYFDLFRKDQLLIVESETFRKNTRKVLEDIEAFLGLEAHHWRREHLATIFGGKYTGQITEETRERLRAFYAVPNAQLYDLLNQDFGWS